MKLKNIFLSRDRMSMPQTESYTAAKGGISALTHSEEKYGHCTGKLQEQEGPAYAREMLSEFNDVTETETERVCYLIAHHHTYENIDGLDYRILLETDFLVNAFEDNLNKESIITFRDKIFRTNTGIKLINTMFGL